ncbi:MAG: hypothetical protein JWO50_470 [Candidatus Kaiserbacteria bacterium]|nr:hypothetical protein [Candidatus Kaiserbacteria bacterium]
MNITKFGHCCLLIKINGKTILTDPGNYSDAQDSVTGIDIVLITHEHGDHCHTDSIKKVIANNPGAMVVCNSAVGKILDGLGISYTIIEGNATSEVAGIAFEACDGMHEEIFEEMGQVQNTGYLVNNDFYIPGDSFHVPEFAVKTLALPVAGPWCKFPDALRYAIALKPERAFPIHDAMIKEGSLGFLYTATKNVLGQHGIEFIPLNAGDSAEF